MFPKALSLALIGLIFQLPVFSVPVAVNAQTDAELERSVRARARVVGLGVATRVSVKLRDDRRMTGHIRQINEDDFVITDMQTGADTVIAYADVTEVKRKTGLSTRAKVMIVLGVIGVIGGILNN